ncbi:hypothetical protein MUP07_10065 [Candidatus Bathyarchaeota archaeon]|nr:hypothetical protein [Candidatus Bathyarchaeota archaeon]
MDRVCHLAAATSVPRSVKDPAQERKLLSETRDILEELLETEEVLRDKALTKSIRDSKEDAKAGRLYTIEQLKSKLRRESKL